MQTMWTKGENDNWDIAQHKKGFVFMTWATVALAACVICTGLYGFFMIFFMGQ